MELSDAAKEEIAAAVKILREDGVHIHRTYKKFMAEVDKIPTGEENPEDKPKDGDPPPPKDDKNEPPKKADLWWGGRSND